MKHGRIYEILPDSSTGKVLVPRVNQTKTVLERMRGLLGCPPLEPGEGLLISSCNSVHTLFMRYPIDVVYLDRTNSVIKLVSSLHPFRLSVGIGAVAVLELRLHEAERCGIKVGMRLGWEVVCESG